MAHVCVCLRKRESVCVCVFERKRERESVCMSVCVMCVLVPGEASGGGEQCWKKRQLSASEGPRLAQREDQLCHVAGEGTAER